MVPQADQLLIVQQVDAREPQRRSFVDFPQFTDWQTSVAAFSSLAAVSFCGSIWSEGDPPDASTDRRSRGTY